MGAPSLTCPNPSLLEFRRADLEIVRKVYTGISITHGLEIGLC